MVDETGPPTRAQAGLPIGALALLAILTYSFFVPAATWAPMSRFGLTRALVEDQAITLGEWADATGDRSWRGEEWYSDKAPVPALAATIPYGVVRLAQSMLSLPAPDFSAQALEHTPAVRVDLNTSAQRLLYGSSLGVSGVAGVLIGICMLIFLRRRFSLEASVFGACVLLLATPVFPYSTSLFGHVPSGACLLGALVLAEPRAERRRFVWAGVLLAASVGCEYLAALPAAIIGVYLSVAGEADVRARAIRLGRLLLGGLPVVVGIGVYHHFAFGAFWQTGYSFLSDEGFRSGHAKGLMGIGWPTFDALFGLTFGTRRGLFYVAPVLLPSVVALAVQWRKIDGAVKTGVIGALVMFLANAGYYMWWGGAATGPRHLVPVLWALAPGLALAWEWLRLRPIMVALAAWSALTMLAFVAVGIEAPEQGEMVFGYAWSRFLRGEVAALSSATNLGLILGLPSIASLVPVWLLWMWGGRWIWRLTRSRDGSSPSDGDSSTSDTPKSESGESLSVAPLEP